MSHRARTTALAAAAAALVAAPAGLAQSMSMGASPEHVSAAYAAILEFRLGAAAKDLRAAIKDKSEPVKAREHAREAYDALGHDHLRKATDHAERGAAVEHLTYALAALDAGQRVMARDHLAEAQRIVLVKAQATHAIADLGAHKDAAARRAIRNGLKVADSD